MGEKDQIVEIIRSNQNLSYDEMRGQAESAGLDLQLYEEAWGEVHIKRPSYKFMTKWLFVFLLLFFALDASIDWIARFAAIHFYSGEMKFMDPLFDLKFFFIKPFIYFYFGYFLASKKTSFTQINIFGLFFIAITVALTAIQHSTGLSVLQLLQFSIIHLAVILAVINLGFFIQSKIQKLKSFSAKRSYLYLASIFLIVSIYIVTPTMRQFGSGEHFSPPLYYYLFGAPDALGIFTEGFRGIIALIYYSLFFYFLFFKRSIKTIVPILVIHFVLSLFLLYATAMSTL